MKTTTEKTFDAVRFMREQRDKLSSKLSKMTKEEVIQFWLESSEKDFQTMDYLHVSEVAVHFIFLNSFTQIS